MFASVFSKENTQYLKQRMTPQKIELRKFRRFFQVKYNFHSFCYPILMKYYDLPHLFKCFNKIIFHFLCGSSFPLSSPINHYSSCSSRCYMVCQLNFLALSGLKCLLLQLLGMLTVDLHSSKPPFKDHLQLSRLVISHLLPGDSPRIQTWRVSQHGVDEKKQIEN